MNAYERIGRAVMAIHRRQHKGDPRPFVLRADLNHPPDTAAAVADLLEQLVAASKATAPFESVQIRTHPE